MFLFSVVFFGLYYTLLYCQFTPQPGVCVCVGGGGGGEGVSSGQWREISAQGLLKCRFEIVPF